MKAVKIAKLFVYTALDSDRWGGGTNRWHTVIEIPSANVTFWSYPSFDHLAAKEQTRRVAMELGIPVGAPK